jgi:hypothetical protein
MWLRLTKASLSPVGPAYRQWAYAPSSVLTSYGISFTFVFTTHWSPEQLDEPPPPVDTAPNGDDEATDQSALSYALRALTGATNVT